MAGAWQPDLSLEEAKSRGALSLSESRAGPLKELQAEDLILSPLCSTVFR